MKHSIEVPTAKSLQELGTKLAQLRYDALLIVLIHFRLEIMSQMYDDESKNRFVIAKRGKILWNNLTNCITNVRRMLMIASPHMQKEIAEHPLCLRTDEL